MWLKAPNIRAVHGFSTRNGGLSSGAFASLNLGGSDDLPEQIAINRQRALTDLNLREQQLCLLRQVHGTKVCTARPGFQEGDALVSGEKDLVLAVSIADCYPLLFEDAVNGVIAAAHAGWRVTLGGIAADTIAQMCQQGAERKNIQIAIGQGISPDRFEVGPEVSQAFREAGFPSNCLLENRIDLIACNKHVLLQADIQSKNIWTMQRCTFENDFFSYRRDRGITGRMWGLISSV